MKKLLFLCFGLILSACGENSNIQGKWVEPVPSMPGVIQGFNLVQGGVADAGLRGRTADGTRVWELDVLPLLPLRSSGDGSPFLVLKGNNASQFISKGQTFFRTRAGWNGIKS